MQAEHPSSFDCCRVEVKLLDPEARIPTRHLESDVGYDIYSLKDYYLNPMESVEIETGISVTVQYGQYITVEGRSSLYKANIIPARSILDALYNGALIIKLFSLNDKIFRIRKYDRVAQIIVHRVVPTEIFVVEENEIDCKRKDMGYGSSGK